MSLYSTENAVGGDVFIWVVSMKNVIRFWGYVLVVSVSQNQPPRQQLMYPPLRMAVTPNDIIQLVIFAETHMMELHPC